MSPRLLLSHQGQLGLKDNKRHLRFAFDLPPGAHQLTIDFRFEPWQVGATLNLINLTLLDPQGFRGAGHRHGCHHRVEISAQAATPGYYPGAVPPGRWELVVHTHAVLDDTRYTLEVWQDQPLSLQPSPRQSVDFPPLLPGLQWLKGDFHCHSWHSDARWSPQQLAQAAHDQQLQVIALTDHNTNAGTAELRQLAPQLLVLPGTELTTFYGHAVVLGLEEMTDWTSFTPYDGVAQRVAQVQSQGGLVVIAHPLAVGDPICTGCNWTYFDYRPEQATHLEVWNSQWGGERQNPLALAYWYRLLSQGRRILATAGTDAHGLAYSPEYAFTFVHSTPDLPAILEALRQGRSYLSRGQRLQLELSQQGRPVELGEVLQGGDLEVTLAIPNTDQTWQLVSHSDGQPRVWTLPPGQTLSWTVTARRWWNLELHQPNGTLEALTNPVFWRKDP